MIYYSFKAYEGEAYHFPNDDPEQNRLNLQHRIFRLCTDNKLYLAPIPVARQSVLDVGTGTGIVNLTNRYTSLVSVCLQQISSGQLNSQTIIRTPQFWE
jgi:hypothetical protein